MEPKKHGGARPGAGRPAPEGKRASRGLKFSDEEWDTIQEMAAKRSVSARAFLSNLVEAEKQKEENTK